MCEMGNFTSSADARSELALNKLLLNPLPLVNISETPLSLWQFEDPVCVYGPAAHLFERADGIVVM